MVKVIDIYGGKDPRVLPRYSPAEAAHYLRLSLATLKRWVYGRVDPNGHQAEPVIKLPSASRLLSFQNLVEAHVVGAIRQQHGVSLQRVRKAVRFVERRLRLPHPLITAKFQTDGVDLFVEELGKLNNASSDGQTVMADALRLSLARVEYDQDGLGMSATSQISFANSTDGVTFTALGGSQTVGRTWFEGIKFGLFTYNLSTAVAGGVVDFDFFHYTHDGPHPAP